MTMTMIQVQKQRKSKKAQKAVPSEFIEDCQELQPNFEKARDRVKHIYEKWKGKHASVSDITRWLRSVLKQWYSMSGITQMIPKEFHRQYNKTGKYVGFTVDGKNVSVAERKTQLTQSVNSIAQNTTTVPQKTTKMGSTRTEPQQTHEEPQHGKYNIDPAEYRVEQLKYYDRDLLISIVMWLDEKNQRLAHLGFKWDAKEQGYLKEIDELRVRVKNLEEAVLKAK